MNKICYDDKEEVGSLNKKTFEVSNIQSVDELNQLSIALNKKEQVSHIKIGKDNISFYCLDIDALKGVIHGINKNFIVKEVVDGESYQYDFAKPIDKEYYFIIRNIITEDDIYVLVDRLNKGQRFHDAKYNAQNRLLIVSSMERNPLSIIRKIMKRINPSVEIIEHRKPIRSQDVFNQRFLNTYIRIGVILVFAALGIVSSRDDTFLTPIAWFVSIMVIALPVIEKAWNHIKQKNIFNEEFLVLCGMVLGIVSGAYIETCIAVILYQLETPVLIRVMQKSINDIAESLKRPETIVRLDKNNEKRVSLYDIEIDDVIKVMPNDVIPIPGVVEKGLSIIDTYSNTSSYDHEVVKKGSNVNSGDINVGEDPIYIKVTKTYESANLTRLMHIASIASLYESKVEKYTVLFSRYYTPVVALIAIIVGVVLPVIDYDMFSQYIHVGAILLIISSGLATEYSSSLVVLDGLASAFVDGIMVESSMGLDCINATRTIIYDRFDGEEITEEELALFKKLSHLGKAFIVFNDGPVDLEDDQYTIYNNLSLEEKMNVLDQANEPVVYIGDSFKDIELLQKSYVGISRGGMADSKVVENSDIVLIDPSLDCVYEAFVIARKIRTHGLINNFVSIFMKLFIFILALSFIPLPLWLVVIIEIAVDIVELYFSTYQSQRKHKEEVQ
ncbi:MAG: hypothetical protein LUG60_05465 [Erysipelotrichaceae bacterium]|nr:hypothetical protein [Erysipelotrichaceae bacterium]